MNKAILLHGFTKNSADMKMLQSNLSVLGMMSIPIDLPLTFRTVDDCVDIFEQQFRKLVKRVPPSEKLHLIGHSSGGLVIRKFLTETELADRVDRSVLIATPNRGTPLADMAWNVSRWGVRVFKTLDSLRTENVRGMYLDHRGIEIGAIAGNKRNFMLGKWLPADNDGRVEVQSVYYEGLKDFIVLPYSHQEIHQRMETARLVEHFIRTGKFQ